MSRDPGGSAPWQLALPLVLVTLGVLELGAAVFTTVRVMDLPAVVATAGPGGLMPVTLAVVFVTLLPPARRALPVRGVIAAGAAVFALARIILVTAVASTAPGLSMAQVLTLVSGTVLGLVLAGWAVAGHRAAVTAVWTGLDDVPSPASTSVPTPSPVPSASASSAGLRHPTSAPRPNMEHGAPARTSAPNGRPHAPVPRSAATPAVVARPGQNGHNATALAWRRGSTPWPRKNEDDSDGTVIRPPRRR